MKLARKLWGTLGAGALGLCLALAGEAVAQGEDPELAMVSSKDRPAATRAEAGPTDLDAGPLVAVAHKRRAPSRRNVSVVDVPPARDLSRAESPEGASPASPSRRLRWVGVHRIDAPAESDLLERAEIRLPTWSLFEKKSRFEVPPGLAESEPLPLFHCPPPRKNGVRLAIERLVEKKLFSEVRRFMKRTWRKEFKATPTMSYARYLEGITNINRIGRDPQDLDSLETEYFSNKLKQDLFRRTGREGEVDFEIFAVGPLVVMDSGSVRFDLGRAVHFESDEPRESPSKLEGSPRPLLATEDYKVHTSLKIGFDPFEAMKQNDPTWVVDRYGLSVEIAWLSDVLGREVLTTEFEFEVERNGDYAALVNFIFRSRD